MAVPVRVKPAPPVNAPSHAHSCPIAADSDFLIWSRSFTQSSADYQNELLFLGPQCAEPAVQQSEVIPN